jgi:hypothetical protein
MKFPALLFFASPLFAEIGHATIGTLFYVTIVPAFAYGALWGVHIMLGTFQVIILCLAEMTQWRLTRHARLPIKVVGAVATYLVFNFLFSLCVFTSTAWLIEQTQAR